MALHRAVVLTTLALPLALGGCNRQPANAVPGTPSPAPAGASAVLAEVNGATITLAEVDQRAAGRLGQLRQQEYEIRKQALDELIGERLIDDEARRKGVSREALLRSEVEDKAPGRDPAEIDSIYANNKQRFGTMPKEDALSRIRQILGQRAQAERRAAYEAELRQKAKVAVRLDAPRLTVNAPADAPAMGPADAPITIVEFTDYQCPFCHRAQATIDQVLARYQGKVRFVHMDFPLDGHPGAVPAARAARCAGEQGRFWEYHRDLMTQPGSLDRTDLESRAGRLGLAKADFATCLASPRHEEQVRAGFRHGEALGVSGTPAYFVNGRLLSGARPIQDFVEVIEAELASR